MQKENGQIHATGSLYETARKNAVGRLREFCQAQHGHLVFEHKFRMVSQAQAAPYARAYKEWVRSGSSGPEPYADTGAMRSAIYDQAGAARQLEAFAQVSRITCFELAQAAIRGLESQEIASPFMAIRGLIERAAHIFLLVEALKELPTTEIPADAPNSPMIEQSERIAKALYGTKIKWLAIPGTDLRALRKEDTAYSPTEGTMDVTARSILAGIDKLDKVIPGTRVSYDILCEFLHPNVGDLYASTVRTTSYFDGYGTRHVIRELGLGPKDLSRAYDLDRVFAQIIEILMDIIAHLDLQFTSLKEIVLTADKMAKRYAHIVRKNYRQVFRNDDLCPCLSGRRVRECR